MSGLFENIGSSIITMLLSIPGIILAFTFKGFSQAYVSKKLGDPTPEAQGRLTMNPMKHIDILGFICMLLFRIGWGKPVPTNSRFYKNVKRDKAIYLLSGAVGLIVLSFVMAMTFNLFVAAYYRLVLILPAMVARIIAILILVLLIAVQYPLYLANFYLLPLPGLDGFNLIANFVPYRYNEAIFKIERYSWLIFIGFILLMDYTYLGNYVFLPANVLNSAFNGLWGRIWSAVFSISYSDFQYFVNQIYAVI